MAGNTLRLESGGEPAADALGLALRRPGEGALRVRTGARSVNFAERDKPGKERLELNGTELRCVESLASVSTSGSTSKEFQTSKSL